MAPYRQSTRRGSKGGGGGGGGGGGTTNSMGISSAAGGPRLFAAENPFCTLHLTEGRLGAWRGVAWRGRNYSEKEREARSLGFSDFYSILVPSATPPSMLRCKHAERATTSCFLPGPTAKCFAKGNGVSSSLINFSIASSTSESSKPLSESSASIR